MPHIEHSLVIPAELDTVWALVSTPESAPDWMPDLDTREVLTDEPVAVGSRWCDHGRLRKRSFKTEYELTLWEPPDRFAYQQVSGREAGYHWDERVELEAQDAGTLVTLHLEYEMPGGMLARLYDRLLFRRDYQITLENRLNALGEYFEEPEK